MLVRFLQDYRGKLTGERFFRKGDEVDLDNGSVLVDHGRAEAVEVEDERPKRGRPPKEKQK